MLTFRIDDVSINSDLVKLNAMTEMILDRFSCHVIWAVSALVHDMSQYSGLNRERIFPRILVAYSDFRQFYRVERCGLPDLNPRVTLASHALVHVDHRLLKYEAQEMSILVSTSLVGSKMIIMPFNHFNEDTVAICAKHGIELIRFEDGWSHLAFEANSPQGLYYFHAHDFTLEKFKEKLDGLPPVRSRLP